MRICFCLAVNRPFQRVLLRTRRSTLRKLAATACALGLVPRYRVQVARQAVADVVETRHRGAGHDDYQFRLSNSVVDATVAGGMARYINHSCAPNCVTRQCAVDGTLHIGIFAARRVTAGEELCYDYKVRIPALLAIHVRAFSTALVKSFPGRFATATSRTRMLLCTRKCDASCARNPRPTQVKSPSLSPLT